MFFKNATKLETFIGANSDFKGDLIIKGTLRIDGIITGNVNADWVVLGETGLITGDLTAKRIIVGGRVEGNLKAQEVVEIKSKGKVFGDILTKKLSVAEGGGCNGRIEMEKEESKSLAFESKIQEA